ncbi:cytochrome-c peroxidase [Methylicorpusculum sp.]|uniref:cytochrome-c peroxidase n=1 Tax=Methylicorpusculum sp. TaxID=2713644 RepID=UPI002724F09F|nr:cytochrome c peroxidase [Methylicorpusculum sp.]MDO8844308.1 cytochrome c peroxidase [Methylicorpusculum sp.]
MRFNKTFILLSMMMLMQEVNAHGPFPASLQGAPIPPVPGLLDGADPIVVNKAEAIALGKALFWDANVGSDGMACASCHYHAGADDRVKNQLNPGLRSPKPSGQTFQTTASGAAGGPNYTLTKSDFPFHQFEDPFQLPENGLTGVVKFSSDDVVSSAGTFSGEFKGVTKTGITVDQCDRAVDPIYHVNGIGTRRVEPRNTPTVINAVFNHRNFWDGRANNTFNGSSPWGNRDPDAGVWIKLNTRSVKKERLQLINSSLASLAVGPPMDELEMSCRNRTFSALGRKLLSRRPLENQKVHYQDSVLGGLSLSTSSLLKPGLNTTYAAMIKKAFNQKYWSYTRIGEFGAPSASSGLPYNQMEANFSMFFGLALQLYQATLVSDQAPIDLSRRNADFTPIDLNESELRGFNLFRELHCNACHAGSVLTSAAIVTNAMILEADPEAFGPLPESYGANLSRNVIGHDNTRLGGGAKLMDFGFFNTGVADPDGDPGLAGVDGLGNALSFSDQYRRYLAGDTTGGISSGVMDSGVSQTRPCDFVAPFARNATVSNANHFTLVDGLLVDPNGSQNCLGVGKSSWAFIPTKDAATLNLNDPSSKKMDIATKAAFKVPTLRNIELTGPYMHNGSMATLEQVIEFYSRAGNFASNNTHSFIFPMSDLQYDETLRADLIAFLKTLTDERVRYQRAPFDHPEIVIPHGHTGDESSVQTGNPISPEFAKQEFEVIPAVGANGSVEPIQSFEANFAD